MYGTNPGEFNFPFQFYQTFSSIYYNEIGLKLNLSQIFVMKLMSGCGKGKYLTKICWKLSIFDSKALISCIFPKNVTNFCDFLENTCMYHVFNQNILPRDLKKVYKCPLFARKMIYFMSPKDLTSFFWWKILFWTDFHIFASEPISTRQLKLKNCP